MVSGVLWLMDMTPRLIVCGELLGIALLVSCLVRLWLTPLVRD